jgi:hypothetical protein
VAKTSQQHAMAYGVRQPKIAGKYGSRSSRYPQISPWIITTRSSQVEIGYPVLIRKLEDVRDGVKILSNTSRREALVDGKDF